MPEALGLVQGTGVRNLHTQADNVVSTQVARVEEIMAPVPGESLLRNRSLFFRLGRDKALLIRGGKFAQTILELRPSLDPPADLGLCMLRNIVAGGFSVFSSVTDVEVWTMFGAAMVAAAIWISTPAISLR